MRNELASRGVYHRDDMPQFSLMRLDGPELAGLDIPLAIRDLLGPGGTHAVAGFEAALYQDFITGEDQFVLTFRGTDDDVWVGEWNDWINNIAQGVGQYAPQYAAAMLVASQLAILEQFTGGTLAVPGNLVAAGHSLGGGLASAASVAGGIPAYTYNAAGLHSSTLNEQLYPGSTARYNNSTTYVNSYYVDYDILSAMQDLTPIPNAVGNRIEFDGPFDLQMVGNAVIFSTAIVAGLGWPATFAALLGGATMVESHGHPSLLYGLLVIEDGLGTIVVDILGYGTYFP